MAALGRRNAGRPKRMTRREVAQRRKAARNSAAARRGRKLPSSGPLAQPSPGVKAIPSTTGNGDRDSVLAQPAT